MYITYGLGLDRAGLAPQVAGASVLGCRRGAVEGLMWLARVAKIRMAGIDVYYEVPQNAMFG